AGCGNVQLAGGMPVQSTQHQMARRCSLSALAARLRDAAATTAIHLTFWLRARGLANYWSGPMPKSKASATQPGNLRVEQRPVSALKPNPRNARVHTDKQKHQIARSINEFGFNNPVLIDGNDQIIAGHGRVEAAKLLGIDTIPTIRLEHLSEAQLRAYVIADNKLALNAGWDPEILAIEFQNLAVLELPFDLEITGFDTAEIDQLV